MTKSAARARPAKSAAKKPSRTKAATASAAARPTAQPTPDTRRTELTPLAGGGDYSSVPLFLWFPPENDRTFLAGVLRKTYKAHTNTALSFIRQKLHPVVGDDPSDWRPTAEDYDIVLPPLANDADRDIMGLAQRFDAAALPHKQSLLVYLTLRFPHDSSLQRGWELGRAFALRNLALKRGLATVLVQHAPHRMGSPNPPHLHMMILPRKLTGLGFGVFDDSITNDAGLERLHSEWVRFLRHWG